MLVHLQIISAESDKIAESIKLKLLYVRRASKEKHFFAFSVCLHFERPVEVAQIKTTLALGCSHVKKITRSGRKSYKRI